MSNVNPVFPKSIFSWSDRVDEVSNVMANDPNSIASDLISVEKTIGVMPHVEKSPFFGPALTYPTIDARISDANAGSGHPWAQMGLKPMNVNGGNVFAANVGNAPGKANVYTPRYDPFNFYNGSDATVSVDGVYSISAWQEWQFNTSGYVAMHLFIWSPASLATHDGGPAWQNMGRFDWNFPQGGPTRWDRTGFNERLGMTTLNWMGAIGKGWRVQLVSENGTPSPNQHVYNGALNIYCHRKITNPSY